MHATSPTKLVADSLMYLGANAVDYTIGHTQDSKHVDIRCTTQGHSQQQKHRQRRPAQAEYGPQESSLACCARVRRVGRRVPRAEYALLWITLGVLFV